MNAKVMYLRVKGSRPRVITIAHTLEKDENGQSYARIGYAICNLEHDQFNRKIGRAIALGRLEKAKSFIVVNYPTTASTWGQRMTALLSALRKHYYVNEAQQPPQRTQVLSRLGRAVNEFIDTTDKLFDTVPMPGVND